MHTFIIHSTGSYTLYIVLFNYVCTQQFGGFIVRQFFYGHTIRRLRDSFAVPQFHVFSFMVHSLLVPRFKGCTFHGLRFGRFAERFDRSMVDGLRLHGFPVVSVLR